ncbi:Gfo/Idh/MocA family oxidoreductase [uncultured Zhongshania sp.]|uniref:Gfo/Idh/MocA family protein n=1 Tax=uncultured Zhongshania sp. TaxID=1642288 RepID=UPI0025FF5549|nr:Gfo/Idh/MocA family oxidoreductase [uncultured Zhongshania sp.]|tara:strand:- start:29474 stop:30658 length:1185 start_codon:yes stop_codon:yes gene_type:complete
MSARRKIRMGMVGGGPGAMIGPVHRIAARLDGEIKLVCGVFSRNPVQSQETAESLCLPAERSYQSYTSMMAAEAALPDGERMDFVVIVTPNDSHFAIAAAALKHGFHVLSDKPATRSLHEAEQLAVQLQKTGLLYGLTHTYAGYPMIKQARSLVASGALGEVRKVLVEYPQGWLAQSGVEAESKQAAWRLDPAQAGISSCVGDIGSHAAQLSEYVCGQAIAAICADLNAVVEGRQMDDDATVLLRFENGARGVLIASQICAGEENNLRLRVYGDKGGLDWQQHEPNTLCLKWADRPAQILRAGGPGLSSLALANSRTPAGHPEGYLEAFANHYRNFAGQVRARLEGRDATAVERDVPGIADALRGMRFIEATVAASQSTRKWHPLQAIAELENK